MTPQEEARERARLLNAWADGKTLQSLDGGVWVDWDFDESPAIAFPDQWRIKQEPRKRWVIESSGLSSCDPYFRSYWESAGEKVTEWQEVIK